MYHALLFDYVSLFLSYHIVVGGGTDHVVPSDIPGSTIKNTKTSDSKNSKLIT